MKHGDKTKAGSVKGREGNTADEGAGKRGKAGSAESESSGKSAASRKSSKSGGSEAADSKAGEKRGSKRKLPDEPTDLTFTNSAVAHAFERAVQSYPTALKRLSD